MKRFITCALPALVFFCLALSSESQQPEPPYRLLKKIPVGGEGGWDYLTLDPEARRLYITRSSHVMVVDIDKGTVVGDIPNTPGVHGVALAPKLKRGFTSNGGDSTVSIFDLDTLKETERVKVGKGPDAIIYDPASNRVFTFNGGSKDATAVAADTGKVVGTVPLGGKPEFAVADEKGMVFVNIEDKAEVAGFDSKQLTVKSNWSLVEGKTPTGLTMDLAKRRLFSTCRNEKMVVLDADSGKVLATLPIGKGTDACVFDAGPGLALSSNSDGTLTVVQEQAGGKFHVLANVPSQKGAKTMALDPKTHNVFLAAVEYTEAAAGKKAAAVPNSFSILVMGK